MSLFTITVITWRTIVLKHTVTIKVSSITLNVIRKKQYRTTLYGYTQHTKPTLMRLNCRVESRRRCVLNSQLVHDGRLKKLRIYPVEL